MSEAVAAVIATFNPDSGILRTVDSLVKQNVRVVVVDDASTLDSVAEILNECARRGVNVIRKATNSGIGHSLNTGMDWARGIGAEYLLTLDQDTYLPQDYVSSCLRVNCEVGAMGIKVGLVTAGKMNGRLRAPRRPIEGTSYYTAIDPMQSGSLVPMGAAEAVGGFREEFVMDCVDVDFCLKLRRAGFAAIWNDDCEVQHELGKMTPIKVGSVGIVWRGRPLEVSNHSDTRRYYMTRNRLVLLREFSSIDPEWASKARRAYARESLRALVFERKRVRRIGTMFEALQDAFRYRLGRRL